MTDINKMTPGSGRRLKENNTVVNIADMIEALYDGLIVNKNAGLQLSGSNIEDETATFLSMVNDLVGKGIARVVIAANWPYDDNSDTLRIQQSSSAAAFFEQITISSTSPNGVNGSLTEGVYGEYERAFITVEGADIRYQYSGGIPTASVGHIAVSGSSIVLNNASDIVNFRAIRKDAVDAILSVTYAH